MAAEAEVSSVTNRAWNKSVMSSPCELLLSCGTREELIRTATEAEGSSVTNLACFKACESSKSLKCCGAREDLIKKAAEAEVSKQCEAQEKLHYQLGLSSKRRRSVRPASAR